MNPGRHPRTRAASRPPRRRPSAPLHDLIAPALVVGIASAQKLPLACRAAGDDRVWTTAKEASAGCASGYVAVPPTNGYANAFLRVAAAGSPVWLNVSVDGLGPAPTAHGNN